MKTQARLVSVLGSAALLVLLAAIGGCTHTYTLRMQGKTTPGAQVKASYWAQPKEGGAPSQLDGAPVTADGQGSYSVQSSTVLDFAGPPPQIVMEVSGLGPEPVCAVVPTKGLWKDGEQPRTVELPPLRALNNEEKTYELTASGLTEPVTVIRMDTTAQRCITSGH